MSSKLDNLFKSKEAVCAVCGKKFYKMPDHMYKVRQERSASSDHGKTARILYFCRYNHYVRWMKEHGRW